MSCIRSKSEVAFLFWLSLLRDWSQIMSYNFALDRIALIKHLGLSIVEPIVVLPEGPESFEFAPEEFDHFVLLADGGGDIFDIALGPESGGGALGNHFRLNIQKNIFKFFACIKSREPHIFECHLHGDKGGRCGNKNGHCPYNIMTTINLKRRQIVQKRALNEIQIVKHFLSKEQDFAVYNDFLIIAQIIPKLQEPVLVRIIHCLKLINDSLLQTPSPSTYCILPLLDILAQAKDQVEDNLLNDFLETSGYFQSYPIG